jgi:hypothetical protein
MLKDEVKAGDRVKLGYDPVRRALRIDKAGAEGSKDATQGALEKAPAAEAAPEAAPVAA